ncbi:MAG: hypothetical protein SOW31_00065 [Treponema sp.]|nr:hypothetical protein [Treponema sp.]
MIRVETTAEVITTCYLTDKDEKEVRNFMEKYNCDLEYAVNMLFWTNKLDIYNNSTESDFHTESIDLVTDEDEDE